MISILDNWAEPRVGFSSQIACMILGEDFKNCRDRGGYLYILSLKYGVNATDESLLTDRLTMRLGRKFYYGTDTEE